MRKLLVAVLVVGLLGVFCTGCLFGGNQNPEAKIKVSPEGIVNTGQKVIFSANDSKDPDGSIKNYTWEFETGKTDNGQWAVYAFSSGGVKSVKLTVVDNSDASATASVDVSVNTVPTASAVLSPTPRTYTNITGNYYNAGQSITFDGTGSSDPDQGTTLTYLWNFGDSYHPLNNTNDAAKSYHQFTVGGNYTVNLQVSDGHANASYSVTLTIQDIFFTEWNFTHYKDPNGYRFVNFTTKMKNDGEAVKADRAAGTVSIIVETFGAGGSPIPSGMKNTSNAAPLYGGYTYNQQISLVDIPISLSAETAVRASIYWNNILMDQKVTIIPP